MKYILLLTLTACGPSLPNKEEIELSRCSCEKEGSSLKSVERTGHFHYVSNALRVTCAHGSFHYIQKSTYVEGCSK